MSIVLDLSAEQQQVLDAVRKLLAERFPVARLRGAGAQRADEESLGLLAELGVHGLGVPEAAGGAGFGLVEDALVFVELGRHLVSPRALATALAVRVALAQGRPELATAYMAGERSACVAQPLEPFDWEGTEEPALHLIDAPGADWALLWNDEGMALLPLEALPQAARGMPTDRTVDLRRCTLPRAALAQGIVCADAALPRRAHLLLAAQLLGMAEATRDMAVDYARLRTQFGRAIGSFQAIKHRCADMALRCEVLRAQLVMAALAGQQGWPDAPLQVDACRRLAAPHALANARANIQVHGGIGFTAECDAHLFLLRAHLYEHLGGEALALDRRLADAAPP